ncbi:MAG: cytidylate kinase [Rhodospirillaceae bacterium]|nr:cytidylate kinase [Rhodospirillaceae bacterium]|tara:strand:- start:9091 stop:9771 length:681 start_codon:yes stop_codon:yes gene_type:complete
MNSEIPVVAIDGPVGSGKGTISRALARSLKWNLLDSGALYRLVALNLIKKNVSIHDSTAVTEIAAEMDISFSEACEEEKTFLDGSDVTLDIRTPECANKASEIASMPALRSVLLTRQRKFLREPGLVADGRDMGSVIFPYASLKVFLTASVEERASRRYNQLKQKGINVSLPDLSRELVLRDERDVNRKIAPLRPAKDARICDSTKLNPEDVVITILHWLQEKGFA